MLRYIKYILKNTADMYTQILLHKLTDTQNILSTTNTGFF